MPQLYTPFMADVGQQLGSAVSDKRNSKLIGSAYMGDPQAMQELMQINPEAGMQIQKRKQQEQQQQLQAEAQQAKALKQSFEDNQGVIDEIAGDVSKFDNFEAAKDYYDRKIQTLPPSPFSEAAKTVELTEKLWQESKVVYGPGGEKGASSAFEGTGMEAQVSNMLTKGAEDPEFRNTPEYARAWQLANEPKVIRTPTGDITLRPELSAMFKAPGDKSTGKEEVSNIKASVKKDVEMIQGTEKELKTTADEKVSFGYLGRMESAEDSIKGLGAFDSASMMERFKGLTNITASTELQQYRQAADDWIRAKLRRESGAVIAQDEMDKEYQIYFPQIGDRQEVIDQKKRARSQAIGAMKTASGIEYKKQQQAKGAELKSRAAELEKELNL